MIQPAPCTSPTAGLYVQPTYDQPNPSTQPLAFPLKHTAVQARVSGNLARVEVVHHFENPFTTPLEATYIFPLPDGAAVDEMVIHLGDRTLRGTIQPRQEAQRLYEQAKRQGRTAGLLEQERPNVFTQSLANIKPGEAIQVTIRYTESLQFEGDSYEFVLPMVVGPRYIPGITLAEGTLGGGSAPHPMTRNQDTDQVPDASRLNAPILPPEVRSGHDIAVTLTIDAGVEIQEVRSPSHSIQTERDGTQTRITLASYDTIPNKDLIVRYRVMGDRLQTTVLTHRDDRGGHFAVYLIPAHQHQPEDVVPRDIVFLIDTSGSQQGDPLFKCQELMRRFVMGLNPQDTFNIVNFANTAQRLSPVPLANTEANRHQAMHYINHLTAGGGTQMLGGIREVLGLPVVAPGRVRHIVLLTDGYIGNENQILAEVQRRLQGVDRLFSFGAGSSVNRFLLNRIAEIGRGASQIVRPDEPTEAVAERFFQQINRPVLTNIHLHWQGIGELPIFYPAQPADLFAQQPLVIFGRKGDAHPGTLRITGTLAGGQPFEQSFNLTFAEAANAAVAQLWGRARIKDLMNQMVQGETRAGVAAVTETALAYQLLSKYTAFVAVSDEVRVNPQEGSISVQVPVEMPESVSHAGVFSAAPALQMRQQMMAAPDIMFAPASMPLPGEAEDLEEFPELGAAEAPVTSSPIDQDFADRVLMSPIPELFSRPAKSRGFASPARMEAKRSVPQRIRVVEVTGLQGSRRTQFLEYLGASLNFQVELPDGLAGTLVFELHFADRQVKQVVFVQEMSTIQAQEVIDAIQPVLLAWQVKRSLLGSLSGGRAIATHGRLVLEIIAN